MAKIIFRMAKCQFSLLTHAPAIEKGTLPLLSILQSPTNAMFLSSHAKTMKMKLTTPHRDEPTAYLLLQCAEKNKSIQDHPPFPYIQFFPDFLML